jgi:hypothetical protein
VAGREALSPACGDCREVDAIARRHLADVERKIAALTALAAELRSVLGQCGGGTVSECRIIEALVRLE